MPQVNAFKLKCNVWYEVSDGIEDIDYPGVLVEQFCHYENCDQIATWIYVEEWSDKSGRSQALSCTKHTENGTRYPFKKMRD